MNKRKLKLLVVDDEIDICNFVKSFFEVRGFSVAVALNGDEAMARFLEEVPDIVLLDMKMRRHNEGLEYLARIKSEWPEVKVIMVTAVDETRSTETAKRLGADDYVTKPLALEYLEETVLNKVNDLRGV